MKPRASEALVIGGVVAMMLSACSPGGAGETPGGFVRGEGTKISVAYPKGWQNADPGRRAYAVAARMPSNAASVSVQEDLSKRGNEDLLVDIVELATQTGSADYRRKGTKSIKVAGAQAAVRVDYAYNAKLTDSGPADAPAEGVDIGVMGKDDHVHAVRITWLRGKLDDKILRGIIDSIRVK
jgi:hypothetical protein